MKFPFFKGKANKGVQKDFPFYDPPNVATITCCHVMDGDRPILYVSHDADDGTWQFLCGEPHSNEEALVVALEEVFELDPSVGELKDMPLGCYATRENKESTWTVMRK